MRDRGTRPREIRIGPVRQAEERQRRPADQVHMRVHRSGGEVVDSAHGDAKPAAGQQADACEGEESEVDSRRHLWRLSFAAIALLGAYRRPRLRGPDTRVGTERRLVTIAMRALLVEDEAEMVGLLSRDLARQGFAVDAVGRHDEAEAALAIGRYALVLLDRRLADGEGLSLLRSIRARQPGAAVIVVSALGTTAERVGGLDAGADDYLAKPFDGDELRARIAAALRRVRGDAGAPPLRCGRITFDREQRSFAVDEAPLPLRRREAALLEALIRRAGRVVQRETLVAEVYGFEEEPSSNTLDAHLSRLRRRLDALGSGVRIHPVRGVGYLMDAV